MDRIGKFTGIPVYKIEFSEYVNGRHYNDGDHIIYLINGDMIQSNVVIARYDGKYVHEKSGADKAVYYTIPKRYEVKAKAAKNELDIDGLLDGVYDTDYSRFLTDIDAFLKKEMGI